MDTQAIVVGDVVKLRSGGPAMTVETIDGGTARVVWFDGQQQTHRESFPIEAVAVENGDRPMKFR